MLYEAEMICKELSELKEVLKDISGVLKEHKEKSDAPTQQIPISAPDSPN